MRWLLTAPLCVDAFIQRHFNMAIHWVMRACGVTKGYIRRQLWNLQMVVGALHIVADARDSSLTVVGGVVMTGEVATFALMRAWNAWHDERAEQSGLMSPLDHSHGFPLKPMWYSFLASSVYVAATAYTDGQLCRCITCLLWLTHEYLRSTPPYPPARKRKEKDVPALQPVAAST